MPVFSCALSPTMTLSKTYKYATVIHAYAWRIQLQMHVSVASARRRITHKLSDKKVK